MLPNLTRIFPAGALSLLLSVGVIMSPPLHAELTDAQKKDLFRKSHTAAASSDSSSTSSNSKKTSSKKKSSASTSASSSTSKKRTSGSSSKKRSSASSGNSSNKSSTSPSASSHKPELSVTSSSASDTKPSPGIPSTPSISAATPSSLPLPHGASPSAPITIAKSGVEADQGLEPASTPPPSSSHGWGWLFGSHASYNYLSASTRAAIDRAPVRRGRWKYIIVHNSGTREGNARVFDVYHLRVRHMQNGLAYHFVIGDGHGSGDGQIEIGHRWTAQLNGGHVASDYLNDIALGICLVGDFNRDLPTKAQTGALEELVSYLRTRVGKNQGRQSIVLPHKEINPRPTDCPGDRFPYSWLHAKFH